jgi:hypothetical protein
MANKLDEFVRETIDELLKELPVERRLEGISLEERLKGLFADELDELRCHGSCAAPLEEQRPGSQASVTCYCCGPIEWT